MSAQSEAVRRLSVLDIAKLYADGVRIATITAYDYPTAALVDEAGIPLILVGDSLAQVMLGYDTTVRVSMDEMLHHTKAVVRGTKRALIVADLPFLSYATTEDAISNAGRFMREAGTQAVKLEGGVRSARMIEALVRAGIPVMGHIGLTPQAINTIGKVRVQGKSREQARQLLADALAVQEAGAFAVVLELVPGQLAAAITERLRIPTIGIGAGAGCSGQIQVITDTLGLGDWTPKHARRYADLHGTILGALAQYRADVEAGTFPGAAETVLMDAAVLDEVLGRSRCGPGGHGRGPHRDPAGPRPLAADRGRPDSPTPPQHPRPAEPPMRVVRTRAELRAALAASPRPVGLVPTMGWLHAGHVSLVERARAENATVVVSIFVNPRQFGQATDFAPLPAQRGARPRGLRDGRAWTSSSRPTVDEVYPPGFDTRVSVGAIAGPLEGAARPGHFDGVATVVAILFALVGAERAYFGLKDYQQVQVIRRMALDLALPTEVVAVRDRPRAGRAGDVVAERAALAGGAGGRVRAAAGAGRGGRGTCGRERGTPTAVRAAMLAVLGTEPMADPDYVSVADPDTLGGARDRRGPGAAVARGRDRGRPPHRQRAGRLIGAAISAAGRSRPRPAPHRPRTPRPTRGRPPPARRAPDQPGEERAQDVPEREGRAGEQGLRRGLQLGGRPRRHVGRGAHEHQREARPAQRRHRHEAQGAPGDGPQHRPHDEDGRAGHDQRRHPEASREAGEEQHRRHLGERGGRPAQADHARVATQLDQAQREERHHARGGHQTTIIPAKNSPSVGSRSRRIAPSGPTRPTRSERRRLAQQHGGRDTRRRRATRRRPRTWPGSPRPRSARPRATDEATKEAEPHARAWPNRWRSRPSRCTVRASRRGVMPEVPIATATTTSTSHGIGGAAASTTTDPAAHSAAARYGGRTSPIRSATRPQAGAPRIATADGSADSSPISARPIPRESKNTVAYATQTPMPTNWIA